MICFIYLAVTTTLSDKVTTVPTTIQEKSSVVLLTKAMSTSHISSNE